MEASGLCLNYLVDSPMEIIKDYFFTQTYEKKNLKKKMKKFMIQT